MTTSCEKNLIDNEGTYCPSRKRTVGFHFDYEKRCGDLPGKRKEAAESCPVEAIIIEE